MKLAFITPRYGAEITGGAEHGCRLLAEHLSRRHAVEVLTTCARDDGSWRNVYAEGVDRVRGVLVRRFTVSQSGDPEGLAARTRDLLTRPHGRQEERDWVRTFGPVAPDLVTHLQREHRAYDVLVFFSLQHATTVQGLRVAPERSLLFPYLQWSPTLRFGLWADVLAAARELAFFSAAERRLLHRYIQDAPRGGELVGIGVEAPHEQSYPRHQQDPADAPVDDEWTTTVEDASDDDSAHLSARGAPFRRRNRLYGRLAMYDGVVDGDNGAVELIEYFDSYAATDPDTSLVLMGPKMLRIPEAAYLRQPGLVAPRDQMIACESADITVAPAADDLLTLPLLESLAVGTPVLANAANPAAVEHCRRSNGGLYYANREEFVEAMRRLLDDDRLHDEMGANGRAYVREHHQWDAVLARFERAVSGVRGR